MVLLSLRFLSVCVFELGVGAQLLCKFVVFLKFIYSFVDFSSVIGSCLPRIFGVGGGWSRRRLRAGLPRRSRRACDAAGRYVVLGFLVVEVGF